MRDDRGRIITRRPVGSGIPSPYESTLLSRNRLIFTETGLLISGPFTPLLAWVFYGKPQENWSLFNLTGNTKDFNVCNYRWVPTYKVTAYTQMREWLTRRWWFETQR